MLLASIRPMCNAEIAGAAAIVEEMAKRLPCRAVLLHEASLAHAEAAKVDDVQGGAGDAELVSPRRVSRVCWRRAAGNCMIQASHSQTAVYH